MTKKTHKRDIVLKEINKGDLLQETVRSYLHSGSPSSMLTRILKGIREYCEETDDEENRNIVKIVAEELANARRKASDEEDK